MISLGICTGKPYCGLVIVEYDSGSFNVLEKKKIVRPQSMNNTGETLDYFRAELKTWYDANSTLLNQVEAVGSWAIPVQNFSLVRKLALWIEAVVLTELYRGFRRESQQLQKNSVFSKDRLKSIGFMSLSDIQTHFSESDEHMQKAIAVAIAVQL